MSKYFIRTGFLKLFVFLYTLLFSFPASADGISVTKDLKHLIGDHTIIKLNKDQVKDVERLRTIELTEQQHNQLKVIYKKVPRKMRILSSRWDSCTCDIGIYAVWCRVGEIDIPHSEIEIQKRLDNLRERKSPGNLITDDSAEFSDDSIVREDIILDSKGNMFLKGRHIDENELRSIIDNVGSKKIDTKEVYRLIYLDIPPPINNEIDKKIQDLVDRTEDYCKKKEMNLGDVGSEATYFHLSTYSCVLLQSCNLKVL